jgi:hypothetical protein
LPYDRKVGNVTCASKPAVVVHSARDLASVAM